jgi:hypothetical protein
MASRWRIIPSESPLKVCPTVDRHSIYSCFTIRTLAVATSGEAFKKIVTNEALFAEILDKLKVTRVGDKITQYHTKTVTDPEIALEGPVTEVGGTYLSSFDILSVTCKVSCIMATLRDPTPENRAAVDKVCKGFAEATKGKFTFGWTVEDNNKAIIISAWDSVEVYLRD